MVNIDQDEQVRSLQALRRHVRWRRDYLASMLRTFDCGKPIPVYGFGGMKYHADLGIEVLRTGDQVTFVTVTATFVEVDVVHTGPFQVLELDVDDMSPTDLDALVLAMYETCRTIREKSECKTESDVLSVGDRDVLTIEIIPSLDGDDVARVCTGSRDAMVWNTLSSVGLRRRARMMIKVAESLEAIQRGEGQGLATRWFGP